MSRLIFVALASFVVTGAAAAQQVPGRDLLDLPLGLLAEAPSLSTDMPAGIWNPAASSLTGNRKFEFGLAGLTTPQEQGVQLEMAGVSYRLRPQLTGSLSFAQASVADILRTDTDPQSMGGEIPYGTSILSAGLSTTRGNSSFGAAARYRWGSLDTDHSGVMSMDLGAIVDRVAGTPVRVAVSSFLLSPSSREDPTYMGAADIPVLKRDSTLQLRAGYSRSQTNGRGHEDYGFATSTYRELDLSGGIAQSTMFGHTNRRMRLGFGLRYAGYTVAIGRDDGAAGFPASYQFLLTRVFP
ncbi:MAG TPA: hypothetical protein VGM67_10905 [Gemmatimonadaceae bacterium]|jgi:hypothetical protein